jgi:hypothetical protein
MEKEQLIKHLNNIKVGLNIMEAVGDISNDTKETLDNAIESAIRMAILI